MTHAPIHSTPNSMKAALLLEELHLPYEVVPIDIFKGEQHDRAFRKINPNGKVQSLPSASNSRVRLSVDSKALL